MFESIRNRKQILMAVLLILIIPSFVLVGIEGFTPDPRGAPVAQVDGQDITQVDWDRAHQEQSQRLRQAMPTIDPAMLDSPEARFATLEHLVRQRVLTAAAQAYKLHISDQRLALSLQEHEVIAGLRRPDGTLDVEAYRQLLARQGLTPELFEAQVRAELAQIQVLQGLEGSSFAPEAVAKIALDAFFEQRQVRVASFDARDHAAGVVPSDAEIQAFYDANLYLFQAPEQADVEFVVLDANALAPGIALAETDVRAYYEQNIERLAGPQERRASHILLSVAPGATAADKEQVRQRASALLTQVRQAPQTFADVARAHSQDPGSAVNGGDLGYFSRGAMVKPFEDAVFALQQGGISELVETDFGFHIIKLVDIRTPPRRSFEQMRPELEADLRLQQAQRLFTQSMEPFSNLVYEQGESLAPVAERFGLTIQTARAVTRQPRPDAGVLAHEGLLNALFAPDSIAQKRATEAIETAPGQLVSARIVQHTAARTQALTQVREQVRTRLVAQRAAELARAAGQAQLAAGKAGQAVAALSPVLTVSREHTQGLSRPVLTAALSANPAQLPAWVGVNMGEQGYVVVKVEQVLARQPREPEVLRQEVQQYSQWWSAAESLAYLETLKARFNVQIKVAPPPPATANAALQ